MSNCDSNIHEIDDDKFNAILSVTKEDKGFCERICLVMEKNDDERKSVIEAWIEESKENGAPDEVVDMLLLLLDEGLAQRTVKVLSEI